MKYTKPTPIKSSVRPIDANDIAAVVAAFGSGRAITGLTPQQKAEQEAGLAPYMVIASGRRSAELDAVKRAAAWDTVFKAVRSVGAQP